METYLLNGCLKFSISDFRLINKLKPGAVKKINTMKAPFKQVHHRQFQVEQVFSEFSKTVKNVESHLSNQILIHFSGIGLFRSIQN